MLLYLLLYKDVLKSNSINFNISSATYLEMDFLYLLIIRFKNSTKIEEYSKIAIAQCAKYSSGIILIIGSVTGSSNHLSLLNKILWNIVKI